MRRAALDAAGGLASSTELSSEVLLPDRTAWFLVDEGHAIVANQLTTVAALGVQCATHGTH